MTGFDFPYSPMESVDENINRVSIYLKRDDLVHPVIEGNKWRKLKYNLEFSLQNGIRTIISVGGAFSNHLLALSQAGKLYNLNTRGYLNGENVDLNNPTLSVCRANGMEVILIPKVQFGYYKTGEFLCRSDEYFVPEGGSNEFALKGCAELYYEIEHQLPDVTHIVLPFGSGGTTAGIFRVKRADVEILSVPVLRLNPIEHLGRTYHSDFAGLQYSLDYHFGGYARFNDKLIQFIRDWYARTGIKIDPIYNAKGLYALYDLAGKGYFPEGSKVVYVHTGGSQGIKGFNRRFGVSLPE